MYSVGHAQWGACTVWGVYSGVHVQCGACGMRVQSGVCTVGCVYSVGCVHVGHVQYGVCTVGCMYMWCVFSVRCISSTRVTHVCPVRESL